MDAQNLPKIPPPKKITPLKRTIAYLCGLLAERTNYFQFTGTFDWEIHRVSVPLPQLSAGKTIRMLHLSDFHASRVVPLRFIENAIDLGLAQQPDIICLTGDYVTHKMPDDTGKFRDILAKLPATAPTFAIFGNHDCCYPGESPADFIDTLSVGKLLNDAGISLLFNRSETVSVQGETLQIAGLGDLASRNMVPQRALESIQLSRLAVAKTPEIPDETADSPVILLSHNPDTKAFLKKYRWDLMLSGHAHGGQLHIPGVGALYAPISDMRFLEGLHRWEDRWIYVTRGIGNVHGIRINCRPWISVVELCGKS